jgi:hypothetical protein
MIWRGGNDFVCSFLGNLSISWITCSFWKYLPFNFGSKVTMVVSGLSSLYISNRITRRWDRTQSSRAGAEFEYDISWCWVHFPFPPPPTMFPFAVLTHPQQRLFSYVGPSPPQRDVGPFDERIKEAGRAWVTQEVGGPGSASRERARLLSCLVLAFINSPAPALSSYETSAPSPSPRQPTVPNGDSYTVTTTPCPNDKAWGPTKARKAQRTTTWGPNDNA